MKIFSYRSSHVPHRNRYIPTRDDILFVVVPAEVSQVPDVRAPGGSRGRHAAVGVKVDVLDLGVLSHCAECLFLYVELDLRHRGNPTKFFYPL